MTAIPKERLTGALRRDSVKKNVAAIHVSGKLSLLQRKLSNVLLLNAYDTLTTRDRHRIDAGHVHRNEKVAEPRVFVVAAGRGTCKQNHVLRIGAQARPDL